MDELKWKWVYIPYLDAPNKQKESAIKAGYAKVYFKSEVDAAIAELKDKCQMHDFFWEGCGFAKRGFKNTIAVSEAFDRLEAENAELKSENERLKEGKNDYKQFYQDSFKEIESLKASHYAEMVDAGMRERRLRRALWLARAERAKTIAKIYSKEAELILLREHYPSGCRFCHIMNNKWRKVEQLCRAKAEQYK